MASAPQQQPNLPLFYNDLMPLNTRDHAGYKSRQSKTANWLANQHAVPLTADEFGQAQRFFPIVFSQGDNPVPLALMGLNEGVNTFVDKKGKLRDEAVYLPAYVRRYPFLLARLNKDSEDMSLCFDPSGNLVGESKDGELLFDSEGKPTEHCQAIMGFCERFEQAGQRTQQMVEELKKHDLLMDGEVAIQPQGQGDKPFVYRGFRMVQLEKLQNLPAETLTEWNKNGLLMLIHAHLLSLDLMRVIFAKQVEQGTAPKPTEANQTAAPVEIKPN